MSKLWRAATRKRKVLLVVVGILAAAAAVGLFDALARYAVKASVAAEYFPGIRNHTFNTVEEELRGVCDVTKGIRAAGEFLNKERNHMILRTNEPQWGWQVQDYRFTVLWRNTWATSFRIGEKRQPVNIEINQKFKDEIEDAVCEPACGWFKCLFA